ncbi:hypothetical protein AB6813_12900 [bacterium RCC_150]
MDQQDNPSVSGAASGESGNAQPQPVIRAVDDQEQAGYAAPGWGAPAGQAGQPVQPGNPAPGWGAPPQYAPNERPRGSALRNWSTKKSLIVGGVAVVVAAAAGAGAYAAGNSGTSGTGSAQGPAAGGQFGQNGQGGGFGGPGGGTNAGPDGLGLGMGGLNAAIHSEYVVLQNGNYVTMAGQSGTVTDISASSMTVKSEDGFSRTYALGSDVAVAEGTWQRGSGSSGTTLSISDVKTGSAVRVTAVKDADKYAARSILLSTRASSTTPNSGTPNSGTSDSGTADSGTAGTPTSGTTN